MGEKISIIGNPDEDTIKRIESEVTSKREQGAKSFEGEEEKTPEELEVINAVNCILEKALKRLGLPYSPIPIERVHFLDDDLWNRYIGPASIYDKGVTFAEKGFVAIHTGNTHNKLGMFTTLLHESIHYASLKMIKFVPVENIHTSAMVDSIGYDFVDRKDPDFKEKLHRSDHLFFGFNETVVDFATHNIAGSGRDLLKDEFDIEIPQYDFEDSDEDKKMKYDNYTKHFLGYWSDINYLLAPILQEVSQDKNEDPEEIFDRFFKGQFTGERMHLRDIEHAFGKKGLRVIALYGVSKDKFGKQITSDVVEYLDLLDKEEREKKATEILAKFDEHRKLKQK